MPKKCFILIAAPPSSVDTTHQAEALQDPLVRAKEVLSLSPFETHPNNFPIQV